jgi:SAM-dependent methyltransferase
MRNMASPTCYISSKATILNPSNLVLENNVRICEHVVIDAAKIRIGANTIISPFTIIEGIVSIGRNTFIGAHSTISSTEPTTTEHANDPTAIEYIKSLSKPIEIGSYVILNPYTHLKQGAIVPDYHNTHLAPERPLALTTPITPSPSFNNYRRFFEGRKGLEVGGPSPFLKQTGLYTFPSHLDNLVFSTDTLWSQANDKSPYRFPGKHFSGTHIINDMVNMVSVENELYDFVVASHVLENLVNPLKGLSEITRVLRRGGICVLILPAKENTFDHKRPISSFERLVHNYQQNRGEDRTDDYMDEVRQFYDISRDSGVKSMDELVERCRHHATNRALHVHVFDFALIAKCLEFFSYQLLDFSLVAPYHQVVVAMRIG